MTKLTITLNPLRLDYLRDLGTAPAKLTHKPDKQPHPLAAPKAQPAQAESLVSSRPPHPLAILAHEDARTDLIESWVCLALFASCLGALSYCGQVIWRLL